MMQQTARSGEKAPLFGGRKPLFTQLQLLKLTWPLLVEQFLACLLYTSGKAQGFAGDDAHAVQIVGHRVGSDLHLSLIHI